MKLSKKAKTKIIVTVLAVCLAVFGAYKFVDTYSHSYAENKAINYLCQKYDDDASAFEVRYNGKKFFVKKYKGKYYDDYQLEDIEKWCTDWLKNNVDERFTGVDLDTYDIIWYQKTQRKGNKYLVKQSDAEEILNSVTFNELDDDFQGTIFFYSSENKSDAGKLNDELLNKLNEKLTLSENSCCSWGTVELKMLKNFLEYHTNFYESRRWIS